MTKLHFRGGGSDGLVPALVTPCTPSLAEVCFYNHRDRQY